jgi:hypothetical protein
MKFPTLYLRLHFYTNSAKWGRGGEGSYIIKQLMVTEEHSMTSCLQTRRLPYSLLETGEMWSLSNKS